MLSHYFSEGNVPITPFVMHIILRLHNVNIDNCVILIEDCS